MRASDLSSFLSFSLSIFPPLLLYFYFFVSKNSFSSFDITLKQIHSTLWNIWSLASLRWHCLLCPGFQKGKKRQSLSESLSILINCLFLINDCSDGTSHCPQGYEYWLARLIHVPTTGEIIGLVIFRSMQIVWHSDAQLWLNFRNTWEAFFFFFWIEAVGS